MEKWDAYDVSGNRVNTTLIRGDEIPLGLFHRVVLVIVVSSDHEFLMMKRSPEKEHFPNCYEPGASGSVIQGETVLQGAFRELQEETGIVTNNMHFICEEVRCEVQTIYSIYFTCYSGDKSSIKLQEHETVDFKWITRDEMLETMDEKDSIIMFEDAIKYVIREMEK